MKTRIIISILILSAFLLSGRIYSHFYSPITGAATAAQFDDTLSSYATARAIRNGGMPSSVLPSNSPLLMNLGQGK